MLGWCLQFTTPMYLASCCCYLGKLQTVQKALCSCGTVNSHLGMSPFFLLWVKFCLGCGCKELRSSCVMQSLRAGEHHLPVSDPSLAQIVPSWCWCLGVSAWCSTTCLRGGEVSHLNDFCTSAPLFLVLWFAIFIESLLLFLPEVDV